MSFEQIVTYIIAPLVTAVVGILGLVKWVIPRFVDAKLKGEEADRKHQQKIDELSQAYYHSEREVTNQAMASVVSVSQEEEKKANEFIRTTVFNTLDKIKTDTAHVPGLMGEIRVFEDRLTALETSQRLLINLIAGGQVIEVEGPTGDYDSWRRRKLNAKSSGSPDQAEGNDE